MFKYLLPVFLFSQIALGAEPSAPKLFFSPSWLYDSTLCPDSPPSELAVDELDERVNDFNAAWLEKGPALFEVLFKRTGLGFTRLEMTATMSLCKDKPSYSDPLVLNVNRFLNSVMGPGQAENMDAFVDLVFHELTHTWVVENLKFSPLRRKYSAEAPGVRNHLHLMAIQQYVYTTLGRDDLLKMVDRNYKRIGKGYERAWEIVNLEGHEAFMKEIPTVNQFEQ